MSKKIATFLAVAGVAISASAAITYNWTNTVSGGADFTATPANWTNSASPFSSGTPGSADTGINNISGATVLIQTGDNITVATLQAQAGNVTISGGVLNSTALQVTGAGNLTISGGAVTNAGDSRISASSGTINVSGGSFHLNKEVMGSAGGVTGAAMTASGTAVVIQDQSGGGLHHELWVGGNNGGSGSLILKDSAVWTNLFISGQAANNVVIGNNSTGQGTFTIQDSAVFYLGSGSPIRVADLSGNVGTVNLNGGTVYAQAFSKGVGTGTINVNGGAVSAITTSSDYFSGFTGTSGNNSVNLVSGSLSFNNNGNAVTITSPMSGSGGLTKIGSGVLTLSGATTYSGATVVNLGGLVTTTASTGAGSLTVADGATFEVQVSASGKSLTNSSLTLGASGSLTGTFTLGANGSTTVPVIKDNGALTLNGAVTVNVSGSGLAGSTYPLISYASISGSGSFVAGTLPAVAGFSVNLVNDTVNKQLKLVYTALPIPAERWAVGDGNWDTTTANWQLLSGGGLTTFAESNSVTFDDLASGSSPITVTLTGSHSTTTLTNNSTKNYIIAGAFNVTNSILVKNGSGTLVLGNGSGNSFSSVAINGGILQLGNGDANGSLGSSAITDNGTLALSRTDDLTLNNVLSGSGSLVQNGSDNVTLGAANTHSGLTTVNSGSLIVSNTAALQNSTVSNTVAGGVSFASGITSATFGALAGAGDISLLNAGSSVVTLAAGANNSTTAYGGSLSGSGNLQKVGTGTLTLSGNSTLNNLQVTTSGSTLAINGGNTTVAALQISTDNGTLQVSGGNTTVTVDSRVAGANGVYNVSGGTLNLPKLVLGSASTGNTNNLMTVSGTAQVNQNQLGGSPAEGLWIGGNNGGSGALLLKDNAAWNNSSAVDNIFVIGNNSTGQGTFTIQDNATFYMNALVRVADLAGNVGTVNLNGGVFSTKGFSKGAGAGTINVNGGQITALANNANFFNGFTNTSGSNAVNLVSGKLTLDNGGFAVMVTNVLSGAGGLVSQGNSTNILSAANTYTGNTIVNAGTLVLTGAGSINSSSSISNNTSSTLDISTASTPLAIAGALTLNDSTLILNLASTNVTVGTFGTAGSANTINVTVLPAITTAIPATVRIIKYTTAAAGLVDGGNNLTSLGVTLPAAGNPQGYLTNNVVAKSIDLVITNMILNPVIASQPVGDSAYGGGKAHFSVALVITNSPGLHYQWRKAGTSLSDGSNVSGSTSTTVSLSNISVGDAVNYDVVVTNNSGSVTSSVAALTLLTPTNYEAAAVAAGPVSLYMLQETGDPSTNTTAFDYEGDLDGTYGIAAQNGFNGITGPTPSDGYPGFDPGTLAAHFQGFATNSQVTIPPLNLNTNTVTLAAWINPGLPPANCGLIFCRSGSTIAGLNFTGNTDGSGNRTLGYTWNGEAGTYGWDSTIAPPPGVWSYVALVITPTNATIYIININNGMASATHTYAHVNQSFSGPSMIGNDPFSSGNREFDGSVYGAAVYGTSLSKLQLSNIYGAASGVSNFPPVIVTQPSSQTPYAGQNAVFTAVASGSDVLSYQWESFDGVSSYVSVANGGRISGATSSSLVISNLALTDATNFVLIVTNNFGSVTSSVVTLSVNPVNPAESITNSTVLTSGQDWNTGSAWSDGNPASLSALEFPGSLYYIEPNGGLRTPNVAFATNFPGNILTVDGNGVFNTTLPAANIGALILKGVETDYLKLVLNGGEILDFTDANGAHTIGGTEVNILANVPIAGLSQTGGRSITISAQLTGNGTVEYIGWPNATFQSAATTALNIAGTNNTFSGTWSVDAGTLVGSMSGALGTNNITVSVNGALQTTYDIHNTNSTLVLNGLMNLTQNDVFKNVVINGANLNGGTYPYTTLIASYPANFPATWTAVTGVSATSASGSITVLASSIASYPTNITTSVSGNNLSLTWPATHLGWIAQSNSVDLAKTTLWFDIPGSQSSTQLNVTITPAQTNVFYRLRHP